MPIAIMLDLKGVTQKQYDNVCKKLSGKDKMTKLADWPAKGVLSHIAGPTAAGWCVVDVWESEAAFQAFAVKLIPALKSEGFPDIPPQIFPLHNFVKS